MQLIYPERRPTSPEELASGLRLHELAPPDRPYLGINMVSSLDGKATLDWRTQGLSTDVDRRLFHHLRTQADAVMVGAGTARPSATAASRRPRSCARSAWRRGARPRRLPSW